MPMSMKENKIEESWGMSRVRYAPGNATAYECLFKKQDDFIFFALLNKNTCFIFPIWALESGYVQEKLSLKFVGCAEVLSLLLHTIANRSVVTFLDALEKSEYNERKNVLDGLREALK